MGETGRTDGACWCLLAETAARPWAHPLQKPNLRAAQRVRAASTRPRLLAMSGNVCRCRAHPPGQPISLCGLTPWRASVRVAAFAERQPQRHWPYCVAGICRKWSLLATSGKTTGCARAEHGKLSHLWPTAAANWTPFSRASGMTAIATPAGGAKLVCAGYWCLGPWGQQKRASIRWRCAWRSTGCRTCRGTTGGFGMRNS